jgi:hypothetical protein
VPYGRQMTGWHMDMLPHSLHTYILSGGFSKENWVILLWES